MVITGDPHADFDAWENEREARLDKLPICEHCREPIQTEDLFDFDDGCLICEDCILDYINERYRKKTENYMED